MTIFLDIDGVLNQLQGNYYLDDRCVSILGDLCKKSGAVVVLTSSWRKGYSNFGKCTPQIEELKKKFSKYDIRIVGRTKNIGSRDKEIEQYIQDNGIKSYVILDDDITEFNDKYIKNLYIVNSKTGITISDTKQLLKYLNRQ